MGDFEKGTLAERVSALLADQRRRWREGETVLVESYLDENPELRGNAEAALELIVSEMKLRSERGERPPFREYSARFPEHAAQLKGRLEPHAVSTAPSPAVVTRTAAESVEAEPARAGDLPDTAPERLPEKLGRYRVVSRLGTGGFGAVGQRLDLEIAR